MLKEEHTLKAMIDSQNTIKVTLPENGEPLNRAELEELEHNLRRLVSISYTAGVLGVEYIQKNIIPHFSQSDLDILNELISFSFVMYDSKADGEFKLSLDQKAISADMLYKSRLMLKREDLRELID